MTNEKTTKIVYYIFTTLLVLPMVAASIMELRATDDAAKVLTHLGYPLYLLNLLGVSKLLGALAIATGKFPRIKEWAYAGFTFDFIAASFSHFSVGDKTDPFTPLIFLAILSVSYIYWKKMPACKDCHS